MNQSDIPYDDISTGQPSRTQRLLIVDDEPLLRASIRHQLAGSDLEIVECENGCDAVAALETREFDLILLDIGLPDISGLEVMDWIFDNKIHTSVIFISANNNIDSAILALRKGAVDFIRKPDELAEIPYKVGNALYRQRLERSSALMAARIEQSEHLHRFLVENSPDLIYTLDDSACFSFVNERFESLLGYTKTDLIGCRFSTIVHDEDIEKALYAFAERRRDGRASENLEVRLKRNHNAGYCHFENNFIVSMLSAAAACDHNGADTLSHKSYLGTYGVAHNITERKIAEETIAFQAFHDQLTSLPNQRLFKDRLEMAIIQTKRYYGQMVGVMFIDIDRFKVVNDTYGHTVGDELLKSVAFRLRICMRAGDTLARKGGDEFIALLPDMTKAEDATMIAEKILNELRTPIIVADQKLYITVSIGIALLPRDGENVDSLLKNADIAMYKVKACGKNGYKYIIPDMNAANLERIRLENDLRRAINRNELVLYYQPQFSMSRNEIVGMEAFIRWNHTIHGVLNPQMFIGMAEETGLIGSLTDWVLEHACTQLSLWRNRGFKNLRMSVTVSPQEFERKDIIDRILPHVDINSIPADLLEIEITENILLRDTPDTISKMRILREHGVRIAIDDFGTCYSSLNYLRMFPVSTIKIDQSFVRDLLHDQVVSPIIQAIISSARSYGLHLLAEGVESGEQAQALKNVGCDEMQGGFFSRPVRAEAAGQLLDDSTAGVLHFFA